jgi:hypothetical protein
LNCDIFETAEDLLNNLRGQYILRGQDDDLPLT